MLRLIFSLLLLIPGVFAQDNTPDGPRLCTVPLPAHWQDSRLRILIDGVRLPGNVAVKVRITAVGEDNKEVGLGSVGVEAIGPSHSEMRELKTLRLDVTRSLKRFLESKPGATNVDLRIQPVDARNKPISNLTWSVERIRIEPPPQPQ